MGGEEQGKEDKKKKTFQIESKQLVGSCDFNSNRGRE